MKEDELTVHAEKSTCYQLSIAFVPCGYMIKSISNRQFLPKKSDK